MKRDEQPHSFALPPDLLAELDRLYRLGFQLLPLGGGMDGKKPSCSKWAERPPSLQQVMAIMAKKRTSAFGIRLKGLVVLDCDVFDPTLIDHLETRFGKSAVQVRTPRGVHLYYALPEGQPPPNLRFEGLAVDVKAGANSYAVGSGSVRKDGGTYVPLVGQFGATKLTDLHSDKQSGKRDATDAIATGYADPIALGTRHNYLRSVARSIVRSLESEAALAARLREVCDTTCASPQTVEMAELAGIAKWVWQLKQQGRLYGGDDSTFTMSRTALTKLADLDNQSDALALLTVLTAQHGHTPSKCFALCHPGMKRSGMTDLSRRRFDQARDGLCRLGFLERVGRFSPGRRHQQFRLTGGAA